MMPAGQAHYEDAFEEVVHLAELRMDGRGGHQKIKKVEDLRTIFEHLDQERRDQKGSPRFTNTFLNRILGTRKAEQYARTHNRIGHFEAEYRTQKSQAKHLRARNAGRHLYQYHSGSAVKSTYQTRTGKTRTRFRDVDTGRFIGQKNIQE